MPKRIPPESVEQIFKMNQDGVLNKDIASALGIHETSVSRILNNKQATSKERADSLLKALCAYKKLTQGHTPTYEWIIKNSICKSNQNIKKYLTLLEEGGRVRVKELPNGSLEITITGAKWSCNA